MTRTTSLVPRTSAVSLTQLVTAGVSVASAIRPFAGGPPGPSFDMSAADSTITSIVTAPGLYGNVTTVGISPYAPAFAFGDFQSAPGTGASTQIEVTFSPPVLQATVTVQDPTFVGNKIVARDSSGVIIASISVPGSGIPGVNVPFTQLLSGPVARITLIPAAADYVAYNLSIVSAVKSAACKVNVTTYAQFALPWGPTQYDHIPKTMKQKGCALTSITMGLSAFGSTLSPGDVNELLKGAGSGYFTRGGGVMWNSDVITASNGTMSYEQIQDTTQLRRAICAGMPVIVGVKLDPPFSASNPGHFVLITKRAPDGSYTIQDPATGGERPLSDYAAFVLRGAIHPRGQRVPTSDVATTLLHTAPKIAPWIARSNILLAATEEVGIGATNASIDVTDPSGNRTTANITAGDVFTIPGSYGLTDRLDDDESGAVDSSVSAQVILPGAPNGTYHVRIVPTSTQADSVLIYGLSSIANSPQSSMLPYSLSAGAPLAFDLTVGSGALLSISPVSQGFVTLSYVCDKTYRVRNTNGLALALRYELDHTPETGDLLVPARTGSALYGELFFTTTSAVDARLFDGPLLLQTAENAHRTCTPDPQ